MTRVSGYPFVTKERCGTVVEKRGCQFWAAEATFLLLLIVAGGAFGATSPRVLEKRWLFEWREMGDPKQVDKVIAQFPQAAAADYNGVAFSHNLAPSKAAEFKAAARQNGLELVSIVMGGSHDRNYVEGVLAKDVLFIAHGEKASLEQDNPTKVANGGF